MATKWAMVRVRQETVKALEEIRESLMRAEENGQLSLPRDLRDRVGLDAVIGALIQRHKTHAERRKKAARKPRPGGPAAKE